MKYLQGTEVQIMPEMTKEQKKARTRKRIAEARTSENHIYYPATEDSEYVKRDEFQLVAIYFRVSTSNPEQTSSF